jgi:hypothetical protein
MAFSFRFSLQNLHAFLMYPVRITCPALLILPHLITSMQVVRGANEAAVPYATFSILLLLFLFRTSTVRSSALYSQTLSVVFFPECERQSFMPI